MNKKNFPGFLMLFLTLFVLLFVFFVYTFLHEGGHALAGVLFGQSLTEFDVNFLALRAHVGLAGGALTPGQQAVQSAAGASLPLIVWVLFISLAPRKGSFTLEILKLVSSMAVINSLLAWIALPVLFLVEKAPPDDVTNFLLSSRMPALLLTLAALILYIGGWRLFLAKIDGLHNELLLFRSPSRAQMMAGTRSTIPVMAGILAFGIIISLTLTGLAGKSVADRFTPPQGFSLVRQVDLSTRPYADEPIWQFTLNDHVYAGVFLVVRDINTAYFDLSVVGPDGFRSTVLHGEGYSAYQDGGLWEQNLPAGTYQLTLTSRQSLGVASVYIRTRP